MKIYSKKNVYDAALKRVAWVFDEFPNVIVGVSGGKDSTVIFHLALEVARQKGRLPLKVLFIDQEAEWQGTIDMIRSMMYHPDVEPLWFQMPIRLFNATSTIEHWLMCWDPADEDRWMRERDPVAMTENRYGTDRFARLFGAIVDVEYPDTPTAYISGVRCEESPNRYMGLTGHATYKWVTWGKVLNARLDHYTFYPIYDWSYRDVWHAISERGWPYNRVYDAQYAQGLSVRDMRISNLHHETSVAHLFYAAEVEPETYARLAARLAGIDMAAKMQRSDYFCPATLPFMFGSWKEYRDYLLEHLIDTEDWKRRFRARFEGHETLYAADFGDMLYRTHINSILTNDWEGVKLDNFESLSTVFEVRRRRQREIATAAGA